VRYGRPTRPWQWCSYSTEAITSSPKSPLTLASTKSSSASSAISLPSPFSLPSLLSVKSISLPLSFSERASELIALVVVFNVLYVMHLSLVLCYTGPRFILLPSILLSFITSYFVSR